MTARRTAWARSPFSRLSDDQLDAAFQQAVVGPVRFLQRIVPGMVERRFGRIVNITSGAVKAPIDILGLSNGARAGLTGFIAGLSRKTVVNNVTINNLLPGSFDTDRLRQTIQAVADKSGRSFDEVAAERAGGNPAGRFGDPVEFGEACAFLCRDRKSVV